MMVEKQGTSFVQLIPPSLPLFLKKSEFYLKLEREKQKLEEEQENAPEFVKVKGNLRRTAQESAEAQNS